MRRSLPLVAFLALVGLMAKPEPAAAEYCRPAMPDRAADVRGYTFSATVTGTRTESGSLSYDYVSMHIDGVFANRDSDRLREGRVIDILTNACDGFGFVRLERGDRILMSTGFLEAGDGPATWNTAVWRLDGTTLRLAIPIGEDFRTLWFTDDRRIARVDTVREALRLVASAALPNTATEAAGEDDQAAAGRHWIWVTVLAGVVAFGSMLRRRLART